MLKWNDEDQRFAKEAFEKWNGFHEDAIHSTDLKPRQHVSPLSSLPIPASRLTPIQKKAPKSDDELFAEWKEKYGEKAANVIKDTVAANVADYEHMKQYAIKPRNMQA